MRFILILLISLWSWSLFAYNPEDIVPGEVIVKFKDNRRQLRVMGKLAADNQLVSQKAWTGLNLQKFKTRKEANIQEVIEQLKEDPNVEFAEPNFWVYGSQFQKTMTAADIKIKESWPHLPSIGPSDEVPIVAVIDSGLDLQHSIYNNTGRVYKNTKEIPNNGIDDDGNGYVDDVYGWNFVANSPQIYDDTGHGTHVSGIILGVTEDIFNFDSRNTPRVKILPLKFLNHQGKGQTSDAIDAIYYAINRGAKVINNSWGGEYYSATLHSALNAAYQKGIVIVAAAGNERSNNDVRPVYPASIDVPSMISVAASAFSANDIARFSNYGPGSTHIFAPGEAIVSTYPGESEQSMSGTSMAAPFVSGLAALVFSVGPQLSGYQIKEIILDHGDYRESLLNYVMSGRRVNFEKTVRGAYRYENTPFAQPDYSPSYKYGQRGLASTHNIASGFGCGRVSAFYDNQNKTLFREKKEPMSLSIGIGLGLLLPLFMILLHKYRLFCLKRRSATRRKINVTSQLVLENGWVLPVLIKDVSSSGAGVQILGDFKNYKISKSSGVVLNMLFNKKDKQRCKAKIMRCTEDGFLGIQFKE